MMIPSTFADLGKAAKDLFEKDYSLGLIKLTHKGKTVDNLDISISGSKDFNSADSVGPISGHLETKYKVPKHGLTITQKWTSSNLLTSDVTIEDRVLEGLKKTLEFKFDPATGKKSAKVKADYKQKYVHLNVDVDLPTKNPILNAGLVLGCESKLGFLAGLQGTFDTSNNTLSKYQYALGMDRGDLVLHGLLVNHNDVQASVYQRLNSQMETAASVSYAHNTKVSRFGVAAKYSWDKNTFLKGKVDTACIVQLAYGFLLRDGFKMTLSGQFDGKNLDAGNHRLGVSLDFEN
jgi:hypothetical protein